MVYWEPWEELEYMRRKMNRLMRRMWEPVSEEIVEPLSRFGSFPVDVSETEDEIVVKADLPGFEKTDIAIKVTENSIDISAQRKEEKKEKTETMFRAERRYGAVRRALTLPAEVKPESSRAEFKNGVLEVRLKKTAPKKKVKEIKVQ